MGGQRALKFSIWFVPFINGYSSPYLSRRSTLWARGLLCKRCQSSEVERRQIKIHVQWGRGDSSYRHLLVVSSSYLKHMCICTYLYYRIWWVSKLLGEQKEIFRWVWARFWDGALQIHLVPGGTPDFTVCFSFESLNENETKKERERKEVASVSLKPHDADLGSGGHSTWLQGSAI